MKIWLNKLKEGDIFYKIFGYMEMYISVLKKEIKRITGIKKELYNERKQK